MNKIYLKGEYTENSCFDGERRFGKQYRSEKSKSRIIAIKIVAKDKIFSIISQTTQYLSIIINIILNYLGQQTCTLYLCTLSKLKQIYA